MEQKRPADIIQELLDYLWNGLGLEEKGWKRLKKGDFKKKMKNGLTYQIWFDRRRYNYIDYEIGHGNVEVGFTCIIKQGDDRLYSFKIEPTTGVSFFRMLTEDLRLNTGLLDTFLPLIKAHYDDTHFTAKIEVNPSGTFYGWIFKFKGKIKILSPKECITEMQQIAQEFI